MHVLTIGTVIVGLAKVLFVDFRDRWTNLSLLLPGLSRKKRRIRHLQDIIELVGSERTPRQLEQRLTYAQRDLAAFAIIDPDERAVSIWSSVIAYA